MLRQSGNPFDYKSAPPEVLRAEATRLCAQLEELDQHLRTEAVNIEDAKEMFDHCYQPEALALTEEFLKYVPTGDPRIFVEHEIGNVRVFQSDDIMMMKEPLSAEHPLAQLSMMVEKLTALICYLPPAQ